ERLDRPDAERITGIPPAVAVTHKSSTRSRRSTVGTVTEAVDYLRLLFAKIGRIICQTCGQEVRRESPQSAAGALAKLPGEARFLIAFERAALSEGDGGLAALVVELKAAGFVRGILDEQTIEFENEIRHGGAN